VQAAKAQGLEAAEQLDRALRVGLFGRSKTISMRHVILELATECPGVDEGALETAMDEGSARSLVLDQKAAAEGSDVKGSPHLFLADGSDFHNPGIELEWEGDHGVGFPVVHSDRPEVYEEILLRASKT
jgi:predicted DsbA family dithiol-disulfide isomerase